MATVPRLEDSPVVPDVALIAVPGQAAVDAVRVAAEMGVKGAVVMSSGFGETAHRRGPADAGGAARPRAGRRHAGSRARTRRASRRFHSGAVLGFSTLFTEEPPADGPVGIISQSGALASVPYGILRRRGIGVRYAHGTGNDLDVTAAELAAEAVTDPDLRLLLLYLEGVTDAESLVAAGRGVRAPVASPSSPWSAAVASRAAAPPRRTPARSRPNDGCSTRSSSGSGSGRCTP